MWPWVAGWDGGKKVGYVAGLVAAYALVLGIISLIAGAWWPLLIFMGLVANRATGIALMPNPDGQEMDRLAHAWGGTVTLFAGAAIVGGLGGVSRSAVFTAAALYFGAIALSELTAWNWVHRWMAAARRR